MKKLVVLMLVSLFLGGAGFLAFAQENKAEVVNSVTTDSKAGNPLVNSRMKLLMVKGIAATADGGVVVLVGDKIVKYDKDLNYVKEIEVKVDFENIQSKYNGLLTSAPTVTNNYLTQNAASISENTAPKFNEGLSNVTSDSNSSAQ